MDSLPFEPPASSRFMCCPGSRVTHPGGPWQPPVTTPPPGSPQGPPARAARSPDPPEALRIDRTPIRPELVQNAETRPPSKK